MKKAVHKGELVPIGIITYRKVTGIFLKSQSALRPKFYIAWSGDKLHFNGPKQEVTIHKLDSKKENPKFCSNFQFAWSTDGWIITYVRTERNKRHLVTASSLDVYNWHIVSEFPIYQA